MGTAHARVEMGDALATGREREDGAGYGGRDGNQEPKKKNKLQV